MKLTVAGLLFAAACRQGSFEEHYRPTGHVAVSVAVDDTANKSYGCGELGWKGSWIYDPATRTAVMDALWNGGSGPFPPLCDDGPWTSGGHEGPASIASDHVLGATMFMLPPTSALDDRIASYGIVEMPGDRWIWSGDEGSFELYLGQTEDVFAEGLKIAPWGDIDLRLILDIGRLDEPPWDTGSVEIKTSALGWGSAQLLDEGLAGDDVAHDGIFTFVLSQWTGPGTGFPHMGLVACGDEPEFVWVLGGKEYISSDGVTVLAGGVKAETQWDRWMARQILWTAANPLGHANTYIVVPCGGQR